MFYIFLFTFSIVGKVLLAYYGNPIFPNIFWVLFSLLFFLVGYLIYHSNIKLSNIYIFTIILLSVMLTGLGYYFNTVNNYPRQDTLYFFSAVGVTFAGLSIRVMLLFKKYSATIFNERIRNILLPVALGVCLIHPVFIDILEWLGIKGESYTLITVP